MKSKEIIEVTITGALVIILLSTVANAVKKVKHTKHPVSRITFSSAVTQPLSPSGGDTYKMQLEESEHLEFKRDPFTNAPIASKQGNSAQPSLSGILWDEAKPLAVVDGEVVKTGDIVKGKKIIAIKQDRIILFDGSGEYELKLE
jgi:hypothetical protein